MKVANYNQTNITSTTTTQIATGAGLLHSIVVNKAAAGTIIVADATTSATSATMATLKSSVAEGTYLYDCLFKTGLQVVTGANTDITVTWTTGMY